ncbi:MAG: SUMF1/EgtB/PvdO family nonheme iron enzyme, partial [Bacteroidales bacterium]|nr:SUMF1/EgtB/PvdO family nonheme iron enzyme [Bacteroidales bacterium]
VALCLLMTISLPRLYSQNDIPPNNTPLIEMRFVPSCTPTTDAPAAQTRTTSVTGFYIAKHKVTRRLWNEIMGTYTDGEADDYLPMTNVSHDEVQLFIFWLNQKTKMHYRLPTETEWTCAVQAGLLPNVTPSFYLGGNDASTGFRLAMDYDGGDEDNDNDYNNNYNLGRDKRDSVRKTETVPPPSRTTANDTTKVSIRALLAAEKAAERAEKAAVHQQKAAERKARLDSLPQTFFFTLNTAYTSMPQWSYGFKIGTVKVVGWYFSAMTNFQYKGAFSPFLPNGCYVLTGASKTTYLGGQLGLVVRPHKLLSLHIGAGFGYRTLNLESDQGWHHYPKRTYYGPTASLGVMFHVRGFVLSAETTGMAYNLNRINDMKCAWGARVGIGYSLPFGN